MFVPEGPIDNTSLLIQVMAWCRQTTGRPLNEYYPTNIAPHCKMALCGGNLVMIGCDIYHNCQSFLDTEMVQVIEILPCGRLHYFI